MDETDFVDKESIERFTKLLELEDGARVGRVLGEIWLAAFQAPELGGIEEKTKCKKS